MEISDAFRGRSMAWAFFAVVVVIFAWLVIRDAWLCDDAFITLRVVDNFHNGYGLRWNVADRVQVFTHPLWCVALLGLGGLFSNLPLALLWFSIVVSIAAFLLIVPRPGRSNSDLVFLALLVPASKATTQFATSGLEGPLACVLLATLILTCGGLKHDWGRYDRWVPLLAAAVVLTRADLLLVVAPLCAAWAVRKGFRRAAVPLASGAAAVAAWGLFSFIYYGSPTPNSALAKLGAGVPLSERVCQGFRYVGDFTLRDPIGSIVLVLCLAFLVARGRELQARAVFGGITMYLLYVVAIGGDFMSGRFFAVPVFLAVAEASRFDAPRSRLTMTMKIAGSAAAIALVAVHLFGFNGLAESGVSRNGISDERMFYAPALSLHAIHDGRAIDRVMWVRGARELGRMGPAGLRAGSIGLAGYYGGPNVHILDVLALGDPLLSRLPARSGSRIGHFERQIPRGYEESLLSGRIAIEDPDLNRYCRVLWSVTRGPVWSWARLGDAGRLMANVYKPLVDSYLTRFGDWQREPGAPALPLPDQTIESLYLPESALDAESSDPGF